MRVRTRLLGGALVLLGIGAWWCFDDPLPSKTSATAATNQGPEGSLRAGGTAGQGVAARGPQASGGSGVSGEAARGTAPLQQLLSLQVLERAGDARRAVEGATLIVDDRPMGVSDPQGLLRVSVQVSGESGARHRVWAEAGARRSGVLTFPESAWPDAPISLVLLEPGWIEGQVLGPAGEPVAGATVTIDPPVLASTRSDPEGRFAMPEVAPGAYRLEAWKQDQGGWGAVRVEVGVGSRPVLRLRPIGRVEGVVVDGRDSPIAGAEVVLEEAWKEVTLAVRRTDVDGHFVFTNLLFRTGKLNVRKGSLRRRAWVSPPFAPVRIVLEQETGVVFGQVRRADGRPVPGARVVDHDPELRSKKPLDASTTTGPEGRYRFEALAAEVRALYVAPPGHSVFERVSGLEVLPGRETRFDLILAMGGRDLAGSVRDETTGQGIEGVELGLMPERRGYGTDSDSLLRTRSDASGAFWIEASDAETFLVDARHPRYRPYRARIRAEALEIELTPARTVRGTVLDENELPLKIFEVAAHKIRDPLGRFEVAVDSEAAMVEVSAPGHRGRSLSLSREASTDLGKIVLQASSKLLVVVQTHDGLPAVGATLFLHDTGASLQEIRSTVGLLVKPVAVTDAGGEATIPALDDDECVGALLRGHGPSLKPPCPRAPAGGGPLRLTLEAQAVLQGDAGGPGRRVSVWPEYDAVRAGADGRYLLGSLGPGRHEVTFEAAPGEAAFERKQSVVLVAGEHRTLDLDTPTFGRVVVILRGESDEEIYVGYVSLKEGSLDPLMQRLAHRSLIARDGVHGERRLILEEVPEGPTRIFARVGSFRGPKQTAEVLVQASETLELILELP